MIAAERLKNRTHEPTHDRIRTRRTALALAAALLLGVAPLHESQAAACTFTPTSGNWNVAGNWNCGLVPSGPAADSAAIGSGKTATVTDARSIFVLNNAGTLALDASVFSLQGGGITNNTGTIQIGSSGGVTATLQALHAINNAGGLITINNGSGLEMFSSAISGGTITTTGTGAVKVFNSSSNALTNLTLNGRLDLTNAGAYTFVNGLTLNGTADVGNSGRLVLDGRSAANTLGGTAIVNLQDSGSRLYIEGNNAITLGLGAKIRGAGEIGQATVLSGGSTMALNNFGTISADIDGKTLVLQPIANAGFVNNQQLLEARGGGTLELRGNVAQGASGRITAENGSVVLVNGSRISGGQLTGSGAVRFSSNGNNVLSGASNAGTMDLATAGTARLTVVNGFTSNGQVNIGNGGALSFNSRAGNAANQLVDGSGSLNLNAGTLWFEGTGQTTFSSALTVRGSGNLGQAVIEGGQHRLVNNGLISADVSGQTLQIVRIANGDLAVQNNGVLEAKNGGRLLLSTGVDNASGAEMRAGVGSSIEQNGVRITGTVNTTGSGLFAANSSSANVLSGVTLNGTLDMASIGGARESIVNGLVLNGNINGSSTSALSFDSRAGNAASQTVSGAGSINLAGGPIWFEGAGQTTFASGITVRGYGNIGQAVLQAGAHTLVNEGLISADVAGQTLQLVPIGSGSVPVQNKGTLEARNGGRLLLSTHIDSAPGAQMHAAAGSSIEQNGVRISGTINTSGSGLFAANSSTANVLSGVTLNGRLDMASIVGARETVVNGLVLNGQIDGSNTSAISFNSRTGNAANQTVSGSGSLNLAGGAIYFEGTGQTTFASGVTVRGYGNVGQAVIESAPHVLVNNGRFSADVAGQVLNLIPTANGTQAIQNNGVFEARNGGELRLSTHVAGGAGSTLQVDSGSTILQNGVTLSGRVAQTGTGALSVSNSSNNALDGVNLSGRMDLAAGSGALQRIVNGLALNGSINVGSTSALSFDNRATANQAVSGTGSIVLAGGVLRFEGSGSTTWGSGVTVRGNGSVGQAVSTSGSHSLVNNGTILADGGTLSFQPIANGNLGISGSGTLQVAGGNLVLGTNAATAQGRLLMGATGTLALGTNALTLSNDYTSAQWNSGNEFNRRAGITGSGQILAGGNAAQAITGAQVSNGNTANATLTIGNVHVGATGFNYQVANSGSTGPTLRGAIQTTANGARLDDTRLSGSGVTAANYSAGAPGGNSGNLTVTFTAASAGALAPLSGQVLNLRSNFDNIADQKLNIVLGAGAAAYNLAGGNSGSPVVVANQRVNGSNSVALTTTNTAAAGSFSEDLNATVGSVSGPVVASGSVSGLLAGASASGISVGVATGSAGAKSGTVNLAYTSTGTVNGAVNGLGSTALGTQAVDVSGKVYQAASGQLQGNTLNFGTLQVGQQVSQNLVVRNTASGPAGFVEDLDAGFGASGNSQITGSGTLAGISAGSNSSAANGTMTVTVTGANAGALNSGIAVNYFSAGAVNGVSNGLGVLGVGSEQFGVNGNISAVANVVNQASPLFGSTSINLGAVRVGAASPTATLALTNQATAAPQAALNATIASNGAPVTAAGSVSLLAPGATSNALQVGLNTAVAGNFTGANAGRATVSLVSDASNVGDCAPNCQLSLSPQGITVSGKVYTAAVGQLGTPVIDFGIVRVGDTVSAKNITVNNAAAATALNDTLRASASGLSGAFTAGAAAAGIAAQGSGSIGVALNTASAGIYSQAGTVSFLSQNPDMADVSAGANATVQVMAQVNHLANGAFELLQGGGLLSNDGHGHFTLNLGRVALGSDGLWTLAFENEVSGPADLLRGLFDTAAADDFGLDGFGPVAGLAAGQAQQGLRIAFDAERLGAFEDTVVFNGFSYNASDPDGLAQMRSLRIVANVIDPNGTVPEPGTLMLLLVATLAALQARRRGRAA